MPAMVTIKVIKPIMSEKSDMSTEALVCCGVKGYPKDKGKKGKKDVIGQSLPLGVWKVQTSSFFSSARQKSALRSRPHTAWPVH
jgi:hypothetical protein